jgi:hypothetical protein
MFIRCTVHLFILIIEYQIALNYQKAQQTKV